MDILQVLANEISNATGQEFKVNSDRHKSGGSINQAMKISGNGQDYFVKLNRPQLQDMFLAETAGLQELGDTGCIGVPKVICCGANEAYAWLVLQYIELGSGSGQNFADAGIALANLHRNTHTQFGWHRQNTIGSTPQINAFNDSWESFWVNHRFGYQLSVAKQNGYSGPVIHNVEKLMADCSHFLNHSPEPSLLHGDLWSGNLAFDRQGKPYIYDPAVYYGDREADLAMTELFGGFSNNFYAAYRDSWPVDSGYSVRKNFYNLYHILNHMNLFGGSYQGQAVSMSSRLLSEIR